MTALLLLAFVIGVSGLYMIWNAVKKPSSPFPPYVTQGGQVSPTSL